MFELSHPVRFEIFHLIADEPMRMTDIAKTVDANMPEVSRHLDRLQETGLIEKVVEGSYRASPMGHIILNCLPSLEFLASHKEFFLRHDLSSIPGPFLSRIGDLGRGEKKKGAMNNLNLAKKIIENAEERLIIVTHETMPEFDAAVLERTSKGVEYFGLCDYELFNSIDMSEMTPEVKELVLKTVRVVQAVPIAGVASEKEAVVTFLDRDGKLDYSVCFYSTDEDFRSWCLDFMNYMWRAGMSWMSAVTRACAL